MYTVYCILYTVYSCLNSYSHSSNNNINIIIYNLYVTYGKALRCQL